MFATQATVQLVQCYFDEASHSLKAIDVLFQTILANCHRADPIGIAPDLLLAENESSSLGQESGLLEQPLYAPKVITSEISDPDALDDSIHTWESHEALNGLYRRRKSFEFWTGWYETQIIGYRITWNLLRRIALLLGTN